MELRRAGHVHFIQIIEGESVVKVLNVGRGLPPLKFRMLADICQIEDMEIVPMVIRPKFECEDLPIDTMRVNDECTSLLMKKKRVLYEHESSESDSSDDDLLLDSLTLTQMKERFKLKKRKCSSRDTTAKVIHFDSHDMEEDCELMESLSSLKSKISKNRKFKRKFSVSSSLSSSQSALSLVKDEVISMDEALSQSSGSLPLPISIKIEITDPTESIRDNLIPIATESSYDDSVSTGVSTSTEEPYPVDEELNDMELHNCKLNPDELAAEEEMVVMDEGPIKDPKTAISNGPNPLISSIPSYELQACVVNRETNEYREYSDTKAVHAAEDSDGKLMVHMAEKISNQMPELCLPGLKEENIFVDPHPSANYADTISLSEGHISDTYNNSQISTSSLAKLCETDIGISNSVRSVELASSDDSPLSEKGAKYDESLIDVSVATQPVGDCSSFDNSNSQSSIVYSADSAIDYSPEYKEKKSVESVSSTLKAEESSSELQSCTIEPVAQEQKHFPERLLSTRKAISPTSQKKLCEAMEFSELDDEQYYKYARKLCYQKLTENKISRPEKVSPIKKCEVTASSTHIVQKARAEKNVVLNKGILKDPNIPRSVPRYSTGCMSLESCSESAILFSEQQMRDVQSIANKLSRELKSLKDIVEETLGPNFNPAAPLKYSTEEVGTAIHNATRVQENAKKMLSIMARDCNRFCKIMKLTDKGPANSGNVACKEKRKIVFADEAGGQLCDFKTFKHDLISPMDSNGLISM